MPGKFDHSLADDHARLDALLQRAAARPDIIEASAFAEFRSGLLKHIAMEEKILLPAAQRLRGGQPLPIAAKLRMDHGALAALLVPSPSAAIIAAIRAVLEAHNPIEEGPGGLYEQCEELAGVEAMRYSIPCGMLLKSESTRTTMAPMYSKRRAGLWKKPATVQKSN